VDAKSTAENWDIDADKPRDLWIDDYCNQISLVITMINWTEETVKVFEDLEEGKENAMKDSFKILKIRLENLIKRVYTPLTGEQRTKIITVITIDVHARDVVEKMVVKKTNNPGDFFWQCQLKFEFNDVEA
jgi:dynein heavy chain